MGHIAAAEHWKGYFLEGREVQLREPIMIGWQKNRDSGFDPYGMPVPVCFSDKLPPLPRTAQILVKVIEEAWIVSERHAIGWIICNAEGVVVKLGCQHPKLLQAFECAGLKVGKSLHYSRSGTTAVSLAQINEAPQICHGFEHFYQKMHCLTSVASPFYDINGEIGGYLGMIGFYPDSVPGLLLNLVRLSILTLDRQLRLERSKTLHLQTKSYVGEIFQDDNKPILMSSPKGYARFVNPAAMKLFDLDDKMIKERSLDKLVKFTPPLKELARSAISDENICMEIRLEDRELDVTCRKTPLFNERDAFVGCIFTFEEQGRRSNRKSSSFEAKYTFNDIIGTGPAIKHCKRLAKRAAETSVNVLLMGNSGAGKEMFAQSIHNASTRKKKPFIAINCAAIPREIAESELFGHIPGAFTGADKNGREGKLLAANGGTVFLDEIGDMPLELQAKLLRTLEERTVTPVGSTKSRPVDIRIIAATNKEIPELIESGDFREDLYYRLNVFTIRLPALADSKGDIPELIDSFIEYFNESMGKKVQGVAPEIMEHFLNYNWPGNIRELRNTIEFAVMLNSGCESITWKDLPGELRMKLLYREELPAAEERYDPLNSERKSIEDSEKSLYEKAVKMSGGNMSEAARVLKVGRSTLYRKLKKFNIQSLKERLKALQ